MLFVVYLGQRSFHLVAVLSFSKNLFLQEVLTPLEPPNPSLY